MQIMPPGTHMAQGTPGETYPRRRIVTEVCFDWTLLLKIGVGVEALPELTGMVRTSWGPSVSYTHLTLLTNREV